MLKIVQSPAEVSTPKPAKTAKMPLMMPPATKAGIIGEKIPEMMSKT